MADSDYTFTYVPTAAEVEKFEYFAYDYVEKTPGYDGDSYISYVGVYFNANGVNSSIYVANHSVTQY